MCVRVYVCGCGCGCGCGCVCVFVCNNYFICTLNSQVLTTCLEVFLPKYSNLKSHLAAKLDYFNKCVNWP